MQRDTLGKAQTVLTGYKDRYGTLYANMGDGARRRIGPRPVDIKRKERRARKEQRELGIEDAAKAA